MDDSLIGLGFHCATNNCLVSVIVLLKQIHCKILDSETEYIESKMVFVIYR